MNATLDAALAYARKGKSVFPLNGKTPFPGTHGFQDATVDEAEIFAQWTLRYPDANIGIPCGTPSGFCVLDVDGPEGEASLADLERKYGALPKSLESLTGRGRHLFFALEKGQVIRNSAGHLGPGLDTRGERAT